MKIERRFVAIGLGVAVAALTAVGCLEEGP